MAAIDKPRCSITKPNGEPCRGFALPSKSVCFVHDPALQDRLRVTRSQGGGDHRAKRAQKLLPIRLRPLLQSLLDAVPKIESGELTPGQAAALAAVAGAIVKVFTTCQIEERIATLEQAPTVRQAGA